MKQVVAILFAACLLPAQQRTFPIVSIKVEGNRAFSAEQVLAVAGLKVGQPADQKLFEAARDRLTASGFFETVGYKYGPSEDKTGYAAVFLIEEISQVYPVRFERMSVPADQLKAALQKADPLFGPKIPGTKEVLTRYAKLLEPLAGEAVVGRVAADGPNELSIVFQPARMPPSVAEVAFRGNSVIPASALQNAVAGAAIGSVWDEKRFRQILDASVRPLYDARGRVRVSFPKITAEPVQDVNGMRVTVAVNEGEVYKLDVVEMPDTIGAKKELLKTANLKTGDIANFDEINAGLERVRLALRRSGFLNAKVTADRSYNDEKKTVDLEIGIDGGQRYTFSKLNIKGLDILSEPVIRKMWAAKEGQPYNPEYADFFLNRLREDNVFENLGKTRAEVKTDDSTGTAEVTLHFGAEPPPPKKKKFE